MENPNTHIVHIFHIIKGKIFVVGDNIDTDQIIPAKYLNLVPTIKEEYEKLGSYAMIGLSGIPGAPKFIAEGHAKTDYSIIIAGRNFGCGSSREHAPIALGAAGCRAVVAESFARIFYRNCIATGELYPIELSAKKSSRSLTENFKTGDTVEINLESNVMRKTTDQAVVDLQPLGEALPVIDAGGIFAYSRQSGLLSRGNQEVSK